MVCDEDSCMDLRKFSLDLQWLLFCFWCDVVVVFEGLLESYSGCCGVVVVVGVL